MKSLLEAEGYMSLREVRGHGIVGVFRFIFTYDLVCGISRRLHEYKYTYHTYMEAKNAIREWSGSEHPPGNWIARKQRGTYLDNPNYIEPKTHHKYDLHSHEGKCDNAGFGAEECSHMEDKT
ncbi:MAG: hypothetical protein IH948_07690 [Bacteroidetes bacterium]|nr:hypothetical protein [Bacteroidota bacterium]